MPRNLQENLRILETLNRTNEKGLTEKAAAHLKEMREAYVEKIYLQLQEDPGKAVATAPAAGAPETEAPDGPEAPAALPKKGPHAGGSW